jgi:hypothetical protein
MNNIIILRCCRDWPVHAYMAYSGGRCGLCGQSPIVVNEPYKVEQINSKVSSNRWL